MNVARGSDSDSKGVKLYRTQPAMRGMSEGSELSCSRVWRGAEGENKEEKIWGKIRLNRGSPCRVGVGRPGQRTKAGGWMGTVVAGAR